MATNFLDKFRSGLKAIQGRQVMALLSREKEKGSITTLDEFKSRLKELTEKVSSSKILPTLELYLAEYGELIDSESFNFMLQQIENDLVAAFQEANDINEILNSHETIINDVVLTNLELAINDIESQLDSVEFLNNTFLGFNNASFNTFRVTQNNRSTFNEGVVFIDPKTLLKSGPGTEASIDFIGEKLLLKGRNKKASISSVRQIFDSEATSTELSVEFQNNSPSNIIDSSLGTFWVQSTLLTRDRGEQGLLTKLELNLSSVQTINYVQIEPISLANIYLYRIDYIDENNQTVNIMSSPLEINSTNKFFFTGISTKKVILVFQNKNYFETQFEVKPNSPLLVDRNSSSEDILSSINSDLNEVISNPKLRSQFGLDQEIDFERTKYFEYLIGFNNIELGLNEFEENSIFVSKTEKINKLKQVGLKVLDKRPVSENSDSVDIEYTTETFPENTTEYFHGSLEYYLIKRDFDKTNKIINNFTCPIFPINASKIRHERIFLIEKTDSNLTTNNVGYTEFYTDEDITEILVYRNGELLTPTNLVDINPAETDGWLLNSSLTINLPLQGNQMKVAIQIQKPNPADIYTVSYTPKISSTRNLPADIANTNIGIIDTNGFLDSWIGPDNITYFGLSKKGIPIEYSLVNVVIVLRRNSSDVKLSPVVEEYLLVSSTIDEAKLGG